MRLPGNIHHNGLWIGVPGFAEHWAARVSSTVALSGIYEPAVVLRLAVNEAIRLTTAMAARHECLRQPPQCPAPLLMAAGSAQPAGWIGQSRAYHDVCARAGMVVYSMVLEGAHHFTLIADALTPGTPLVTAVLCLVTGR